MVFWKAAFTVNLLLWAWLKGKHLLLDISVVFLHSFMQVTWIQIKHIEVTSVCALRFRDGNVRMFLLLAHVKVNACALPSLPKKKKRFFFCLFVFFPGAGIPISLSSGKVCAWHLQPFVGRAGVCLLPIRACHQQGCECGAQKLCSGWLSCSPPSSLLPTLPSSHTHSGHELQPTRTSLRNHKHAPGLFSTWCPQHFELGFCEWINFLSLQLEEFRTGAVPH